MSAHIVLDIARLLSSVGRGVPSGIERVELAYARHLLARHGEGLSFAVRSTLRGLVPVPRQHASHLVEALDARWGAGKANPRARDHCLQAARRIELGMLRRGPNSLRSRLRKAGAPAVYLCVSHQGLGRPVPLAHLQARAGARLVFLVHDLIPIVHPEYARPGQSALHARRMETVARLADAVIFNSDATRRQFESRYGPPPMAAVAPLGVDPRFLAGRDGETPTTPYFVCLGTIEPRKNHLLLLNLWRQMAAARPQEAPCLIIAGRRGWENENVVDMIERCTAIHPLVEELNTIPDGGVRRLLSGARALLLPSFDEGYGLPVAEALALGVPVVCSDLPALREVGAEVPEYLDPLDAPAWRAAILDYAQPHSPRRAAQLARLAGWRAPTWQAHFDVVEPLLEAAASRPVRAPRPLPGDTPA